MTEVQRAAAIRGKTIRLTWTEGPTKGTTHEHVFHEDGTVEWHDTSPQKGRSTDRQQKSASANEKPKYAAGFASSSKEWYPVHGTFEVVK